MRDTCRIDLATTAPFRIGPLHVEPALRQVSTADTDAETLEPRVMLVLVALARAEGGPGGGIVSRDQLIEQCWDSRIVGDDSINRVISRLRKLAGTNGDALFAIETISKVGYRLVPAQSPVDESVRTDAGFVERRSRDMATPAPPSRRNRAVALSFGLLASALVGLGWIARPAGAGLAKPVVEVEPFTVAAGGIAPGLPTAVRAETVNFLANERRYSITQGPPGSSSSRNWRVKGTITPADGGRQVVVFAQLFKPGSDIAVTEMRIDRDANQPMLAGSFGLRIGRTYDCILLTVTDPDLTGGYTESGLPALVDACVTWHNKGSSPSARIEKFRAAGNAFPRSSYFPARLGEMLGDLAADGAADAARLRAQGSALVGAAEHNDPTQPHIFLARARLLPALDYFGREAMFRKALAARPSDCSCEFGDYSNFLSMVGRNHEARIFAERAHEREPKNIPWLRRVGETAAVERDYDGARSILAEVAGYLPDRSSLDGWRMNLAIWSADWPLAQAMNAREPDPSIRAMRVPLISALASGNASRIGAARAPFVARAGVPATNDRATVTALAMAGLPVQAVEAADRLIALHPLSMTLLFEPGFAQARATPQFASLAGKLGLIAYWRKSGRPPDFCLGTDAPRMCAGMNRAPATSQTTIAEQ